jgi:uncharacterized protein
MVKDLSTLLEIQDFDMQMIQLMEVKHARNQEQKIAKKVQDNLSQKKTLKDAEIAEIKKIIRLIEGEVSDIKEAVKRLESQQNQVKKVEEFNALNIEVSSKEKERNVKEKKLSDLYDQLAVEEDALILLSEKVSSNDESNTVLEKEIAETIIEVNKEGKVLKTKRDALVPKVDAETFAIYERLLRNKKDRVVVAIENRSCNGCHITITAQHENLVRRGERLNFCEHCSRIHYWPENALLEEQQGAPVRQPRRRKAAT